MYRPGPQGLEVFIAHPGGPWLPNKSVDVWTIPKGEVEPGESLLTAAIREFTEEVGLIPHGPFLPLGSIRQKGGKTVHAWAFRGDLPPGTTIRSNLIELEWPPGSGRWGRWPEIDRAEFFPLPTARRHLKLAQHDFLERLTRQVGDGAAPASAPSIAGPEIDHEDVRENRPD